jgi:hypothetical protein
MNIGQIDRVIGDNRAYDHASPQNHKESRANQPADPAPPRGFGFFRATLSGGAFFGHNLSPASVMRVNAESMTIDCEKTRAKNTLSQVLGEGIHIIFFMT